MLKHREFGINFRDGLERKIKDKWCTFSNKAEEIIILMTTLNKLYEQKLEMKTELAEKEKLIQKTRDLALESKEIERNINPLRRNIKKLESDKGVLTEKKKEQSVKDTEQVKTTPLIPQSVW